MCLRVLARGPFICLGARTVLGVGLAAGIVYNWWIVHTRNLADCILAHAVTNAVLSVYVLFTDQWQYWL